MLKDQHKNST